MTNRPRVIFAGTSDFAVPALQELSKVADILVVLTQPRKPAGRGLKERQSAVDTAAQELGLPLLHPETLKRSLFEETLSAYPCDYLIVASYGKIIPRWMLAWPKIIALNIHGSLLPRWRGASPIQHALLYGDAVTGVGIMEMTTGLDEGPVFLEKHVPIEEQDNQNTLTEKMAAAGAQALVEALSQFPLPPQEQQGTPSYAPKILKEQGQVCWDKTAQEIINQFRALTPWPGLFTFDAREQRVKFPSIALRPACTTTPGKPGQAEINDGRLLVHTGSDAIEILSVQWEGKKALTIAEALKTNHPALSQPLVFQ